MVLTARSLPMTRINKASAADSDTSVHDKYIAAAILETQKNDELDDTSHAR